MVKQFDQNRIFWLMFLAAAAFCLSVYSPVSYTRADPSGTLLTAQSLLQNGSLKLDAYKPWIPPSYRFVEVHSHTYYVYPVGTPLFTAPIVWAAGLTGNIYLPFTPADEALQNIISGLSVALCAMLMYFLAKAFLPALHSYTLAIAFTFGTSILSTMGTALWSTNFAMLFSLGALILIAYEAKGNLTGLNPYGLGLLLFSAYLCRPSEAVFVGIVFLYVLVYRRNIFLRLAATVGGLMVVFVVSSYLELHQILPEYYRSSDFALSMKFFTAFYANLFSPSRGLLIFSPFLALILVGTAAYGKTLIKNPFFQLAGIWFLSHLFMVSAWKVWWGGQSYGPRLFTDCLPALLILLALIWKSVIETVALQGRRVWTGVFAVLVGVSVFIHSYQGMFNRWTDIWNDGGSAVSFLDWRYPQFLASAQQLTDREVEFEKLNLQPYVPGARILADSSWAVFENFYSPEPLADGSVIRWSKGMFPSIYLQLDSQHWNQSKDYRFLVKLGGFEDIKVKFLFNGVEIGSTPLRSQGAEEFSMVLPGKSVKPGELNQLKLVVDFSNANLSRFDIKSDSRMRGIQFFGLDIGK